MRPTLIIAAILVSASSLGFAGKSDGGKNDGKDAAVGGTARGDGINLDGSSDDAAKCRARTAGAALCNQRHRSKDM